jgi:hypothetical protein
MSTHLTKSKAEQDKKDPELLYDIKEKVANNIICKTRDGFISRINIEGTLVNFLLPFKDTKKIPPKPLLNHCLKLSNGKFFIFTDVLFKYASASSKLFLKNLLLKTIEGTLVNFLLPFKDTKKIYNDSKEE